MFYLVVTQGFIIKAYKNVTENYSHLYSRNDKISNAKFPLSAAFSVLHQIYLFFQSLLMPKF